MSERLKEELKALLSQQPSLASEFLGVISESLLLYESSVRKARSALADRALAVALQPDWIEKVNVPYSIDAIFHQFPSGIQNHSPHEVSCFLAFKKKAEDWVRDPGWVSFLRDIKGHEVYRWFLTFIVPRKFSEFEVL